MHTSWIKRDHLRRILFSKSELKKYYLKSIMHCKYFLNNNLNYYLFKLLFKKYSRNNSISAVRRCCVFSRLTRSVFQQFKMVRHQCQFFAKNGYLVGLRKASF